MISSCEDGVVTVWSVDNGHKIKQFVDCHGNNELTTMLLQEDGSRLLTGLIFFQTALLICCKCFFTERHAKYESNKYHFIDNL